MKYKYLSRALKQNRKWGRAFKWEWRVVWNLHGTQKHSHGFSSRAAARQFKNVITTTCNPRLQRRLVAVDWEDYTDTFSYNAKGNGNGR